MSFKFRDTDSGCVGSLTVPLDVPGMPGALVVSAVGSDRADALAKAAAIAKRISEDPILAALMPPQAKAAIAAARKLAGAAKRGRRALFGLWRKFKGPGKKRLAEALARDPKCGGDDSVEGIRSFFKKASRKLRLRRKPSRRVMVPQARGGRGAARPVPQRAPAEPDDDGYDEPDDDGYDEPEGDDVSGGDWIDPATYGEGEGAP